MRIIDKKYRFRGEYKKHLCTGNRFIRDSRTSPTEHQVHYVPDKIPCSRHVRIAQVILEVTRDSQVTGTCIGRVRMRHRPRTWERNTAQRVICARSRYCLCNRDRKNWPFATGILLTEPARDANCDPRSTNAKMGIGSGHRRVPNTRQYDVESKILDKISHGDASTVDKSTTGRFPYQQGTFLRGQQVKIRVNR